MKLLKQILYALLMVIGCFITGFFMYFAAKYDGH